jgi:hypothetical protein
MPRLQNTGVMGYVFTPYTIKAVWNKGARIRGYDPSIWRQDQFGHIIHFDDYENTESAYGWHIVQIKPMEINGSRNLANLIPLYWETNLHKIEHFLTKELCA